MLKGARVGSNRRRWGRGGLLGRGTSGFCRFQRTLPASTSSPSHPMSSSNRRFSAWSEHNPMGKMCYSSHQTWLEVDSLLYPTRTLFSFQAFLTFSQEDDQEIAASARSFTYTPSFALLSSGSFLPFYPSLSNSLCYKFTIPPPSRHLIFVSHVPYLSYLPRLSSDFRSHPAFVVLLTPTSSCASYIHESSAVCSSARIWGFGGVVAHSA